MAEIKLSEARTLCSASELQLVKASSKRSLAKMGEAQVKKNIEQARKLRDKWRDVSTRQRRDTQRKQNARTTDENARSAEKHELFSQVLAKFEAHLQQVAGTGQGEKPTPTTPKKKRAKAHREARASTRDTLETKRAKLNESTAAKRKTVKKKAAKKKAAKKAASPSATAEKQAVSAQPPAPKKKVAKKTPKKVSAKGNIPVASLTKGKFNSEQQIEALASKKRARVKVSGLDSRTRGHVSARGRRAQGKRDSR